MSINLLRLTVFKICVFYEDAKYYLQDYIKRQLYSKYQLAIIVLSLNNGCF